MNAVAHVDRRGSGRRRAEPRAFSTGSGWGLGLVTSSAHTSTSIIRLQPGQRQAAQRPRPVLAGDEAGRRPAARIASHGRDDAGVHGDHPVVVGEVVFAIRRDQRLEHSLVVAPLGELHGERRPDAAEPVFVGPRRKAVRGERVMVAVENQADRIDERTVEIEQNGLEVDMRGNVVGWVVGLRACSGISMLTGFRNLGVKHMQPTELVAIMAAIIYSGRREGDGPHAGHARRPSKRPGTSGISPWTSGATRAPGGSTVIHCSPDDRTRRSGKLA